MNGHYELHGVPALASRALLVDLLTGEIGFDRVLDRDLLTSLHLAS